MMKNLKHIGALVQKNRYSLMLWGLALVGMFLVWSTFGTISRNYELQLRVSELRAEIAELELDNENTALQNEFLETDEFLEQAARQQLGLAREGETVFLEPNAILDELRKPPTLSDGETATLDIDDGWRANVEEWISFLFQS